MCSHPTVMHCLFDTIKRWQVIGSGRRILHTDHCTHITATVTAVQRGKFCYGSCSGGTGPCCQLRPFRGPCSSQQQQQQPCGQQCPVAAEVTGGGPITERRSSRWGWPGQDHQAGLLQHGGLLDTAGATQWAHAVLHPTREELEGSQVRRQRHASKLQSYWAAFSICTLLGCCPWAVLPPQLVARGSIPSDGRPATQQSCGPTASIFCQG
jgi:hypothetical protein